MNQRLIDQLTTRLAAVVGDHALAWQLAAVPFPERSHVQVNLRNLGRTDLGFCYRFDWLLCNRVGDDLPQHVPGDTVRYRGTRCRVLWVQPGLSGWEVSTMEHGLVREAWLA